MSRDKGPAPQPPVLPQPNAANDKDKGPAPLPPVPLPILPTPPSSPLTPPSTPPFQNKIEQEPHSSKEEDVPKKDAEDTSKVKDEKQQELPKKQDDFLKKHVELTKKHDELAKKQEELTRKKEELAKKQEELTKREEELKIKRTSSKDDGKLDILDAAYNKILSEVRSIDENDDINLLNKNNETVIINSRGTSPVQSLNSVVVTTQDKKNTSTIIISDSPDPSNSLASNISQVIKFNNARPESLSVVGCCEFKKYVSLLVLLRTYVACQTSKTADCYPISWFTQEQKTFS